MIRFGPYQVDPRTWSLSRGGDPVDLSPRLVEILAAIVEKNGEIVTKDELLDRFWPGVNISENTLTRAVADIRKALGEQASEPQYIQTLARRGFRFISDSSVERSAPEDDPFQAWVQGKLALDSLNPEKLSGAIAAFERAVMELPSYAPAHAGLANAYLLKYEQTRSGSVPDRGPPIPRSASVPVTRTSAAAKTAMTGAHRC